jgi:hypothetical protein
VLPPNSYCLISIANANNMTNSSLPPDVKDGISIAPFLSDLADVVASDGTNLEADAKVLYAVT